MSEQVNAVLTGTVQQNLQSIPVELRMMIFGYVLLDSEPMDLTTHGLKNVFGPPCHQAVKSFRALSLQCRAMHYEAEDIFFTHNTFRFRANSNLPSIPARHVNMMAKIQLCRTLIGKMFLFRIHHNKDNTFRTSIGLLDLVEDPTKEQTLSRGSFAASLMAERMVRGIAKVETMIRKELEDGKGVHMAVVKEIAKRMNEQWLIAFY